MHSVLTIDGGYEGYGTGIGDAHRRISTIQCNAGRTEIYVQHAGTSYSVLMILRTYIANNPWLPSFSLKLYKTVCTGSYANASCLEPEHPCVWHYVNKLGLDLGLLGKISSLQGIKAHVICHFCFPTEVEEVEAELTQAVEIHNPTNPPTLEIIRYAEDRMVKSDSDS